MAKSGSKINESLQQPLVRQFSVFLENKVGALLDLDADVERVERPRLRHLGRGHGGRVGGADRGGRSRERAMRRWARPGYRSTSPTLVVVELPRGPEKLDTVLRGLVAAEVNIQYTYSLMVRPHDKALLALHCEDSEFARDVLVKEGYSVLSQKDISR